MLRCKSLTNSLAFSWNFVLQALCNITSYGMVINAKQVLALDGYFFVKTLRKSCRKCARGSPKNFR